MRIVLTPTGKSIRPSATAARALESVRPSGIGESELHPLRQDHDILFNVAKPREESTPRDGIAEVRRDTLELALGALIAQKLVFAPHDFPHVENCSAPVIVAASRAPLGPARRAARGSRKRASARTVSRARYAAIHNAVSATSSIAASLSTRGTAAAYRVLHGRGGPLLGPIQYPMNANVP